MSVFVLIPLEMCGPGGPMDWLHVKVCGNTGKSVSFFIPEDSEVVWYPVEDNLEG